MKFEKFMKNAGVSGVIVEDIEDIKWLMFNAAMLRIPDGVNVVAPCTIKEKPFITNVLDAWNDGNVIAAELCDARLPEPGASGSKILRVFKDDEDGVIEISNKNFAVIEKSDAVYTAKDGDDVVALVVCTGYGEDQEISGIIFDANYFAVKMTERN